MLEDKKDRKSIGIVPRGELAALSHDAGWQAFCSYGTLFTLVANFSLIPLMKAAFSVLRATPTSALMGSLKTAKKI